MNEKVSPKTTEELIAALADGEIELCNCPELFRQLAADTAAARKVADQQRLREAVSKCLCLGEDCCPDELADKLRAMAEQQPASAQRALAVAAAATPAPTASAQPAPQAGNSPVLARIGRWAPAAVAAMVLLVAGVMFQQASRADAPNSPAAILTTNQVSVFASRHGDCAQKPDILKDHDRFGEAQAIQALPGRLGEYFNRSADGINLDLSKIGYDYQMTGACSLPGSGAVHLVYRNHDQPDRSLSIWLKPDDGNPKIETGRLYVEAANNLDRPVIIWKENGLIYYLCGDSLEDSHKAVDALRQRA